MFQVYHVTPDKTEKLLYKVQSSGDVKYILDTSDYPGVWISDTRKVLRKNKGEIQIRTEALPMVVSYEAVSVGRRHFFDLKVLHHDTLSSIRISEYLFTGYGHTNEQLWHTGSLLELSSLVGKEVAYQCKVHYDRYLATFSLKGAM